MLLLLLIGLVACARADCDVCITGICHSRNTLIQGYATDQLAIDRTNNILYTQLNYTLNIALYLNEPNISRLIQKKKTSGMVVDQDTQDLYTSQFGIIYRYKYNHNYSIDSFTLGQHIAHKLGYDDNLYLITPGGRLVYLKKTTEVPNENHLQDYDVTDMVKVNSTTFFIANDNVYMFDWDDEAPKLICKNKQALSTDKYGDAYFVDNSQKIIYKRDKTGKFEVYASWKSGSVRYFVFDKDNNIVFRDMEDVISQWIPENVECVDFQNRDVCHMMKED